MIPPPGPGPAPGEPVVTRSLTVMSVRGGFLAVALLLTSVNLAGIWLPGWTYLPRNLAVLVLQLIVARRAGATDADLGLQWDRVRAGLRFGVPAAILMAAGIAALALIPATRGLFEDERAAGIGIAGLLYQVVLRIPIGTALFEEFAFRGVLLGLGRRGWGSRAGATMSALLFGLWHIVPAVTLAETNASTRGMTLSVVVVLAVASTTAAGLILGWVRDRTGSLAAPVAIHAVINAVSFTAAWMLR